MGPMGPYGNQARASVEAGTSFWHACWAFPWGAEQFWNAVAFRSGSPCLGKPGREHFFSIFFDENGHLHSGTAKHAKTLGKTTKKMCQKTTIENLRKKC